MAGATCPDRSLWQAACELVSIILEVAWVRVTAIANASASTEEVVRIEALVMRGFLEAAPATIVWLSG